MGRNTVVPLADLERETVAWCREMAALSPSRCDCSRRASTPTRTPRRDPAALHDATLLFYMTEEGQEGRNAYQEGRSPDFSKFPKRP
jgi:naphthoate synthase